MKFVCIDGFFGEDMGWVLDYEGGFGGFWF